MSRSENQLWEAYTPIMKAAANGLLSAVREEVETKKVDINEQGGWNKVTALMLAAEGNRLAVLKYLIQMGADVDLKNDLGNTALMIAADCGHLDIVIELANHGADITLGNEYKHTALIIATEKGHLNVVQWLASYRSKDPDVVIPDQLNVPNKYDKTALIVAAEFGQAKVAEWIIQTESLNADVNIHTKKDITPLMFACSGGSKAHERIVDLLLEKHADVNKKSNEGDTALIRAAMGGNERVVEKLLAHNASVDIQNKAGLTALMTASKRGHEKVVQVLLNHGAERRLITEDSEQHGNKMNAMKYAWLQGHVEIATKYFMIPWNERFNTLSRRATDIFDEQQLAELAKKYANPSHAHSLKALVIYAVYYDFHFDLLVSLIPRFKTPNTVLNKQMIVFYQTLYAHQDASNDVSLISKLVELSAAFAKAAINHPLERIDLQERITCIFRMLQECLSSDCMDNERTVQRILCSSSNRWWKQNIRFKNDAVEKAQAFMIGPLETSIRCNVTALFCTGHVSTYTNNLFWGYLRSQPDKGQNTLWFAPNYWLPKSFLRHFSKESENIRRLQSKFIYYRFCPAAMFFGEGLSKLMFLGLIAYTAVYTVGDGQVHTWNYSPRHHYLQKEIMILILAITTFLYEYGQLCENTTRFIPAVKNVLSYGSEVWNWLDDFGLVLVIVWAILAFTGSNQNSSMAALAALSTSVIFFSVGILRYISVYEPVGKLVIMVIAMMRELVSFAVVFIICMFGFCVAMYSLLESTEDFKTMDQTVLTLFSSTLQNYDSAFTLGGRSAVRPLVVTIQIVYIVVSSIVLLNLVIARMTAIHHKIDEKSFQEWQFTRALMVQQYLVLEERSPFCMLPPPFNLLPTLAFPLHSLYLNLVSRFSANVLNQTEPSRLLSPSPRKRSPIHTQLSRLFSTSFSRLRLSSAAKLAPYDEVDERDRGESDVDFIKTGEIESGTNTNLFSERQEPKKHISLAGTVSDITAGIVMAFIAPIFELIYFVGTICNRLRVALATHHSIYKLLVSDLVLELFVIVASFPVIYVLYAISLIWKTVVQGSCTRVILEKAEDEVKFIVCYDEVKVYEYPILLPTDVDVLIIKVLRAEFSKCTLDSNPIIKFRIGNMEACTKPSVYGGPSPQWSKEVLYFPLRSLDLTNDTLTFEVVDKDPLTSKEAFVGEHVKNSTSIKKWIGNRSFEGTLKLDDGGGFVFINVKIDFPSFMAMEPNSSIPVAERFSWYQTRSPAQLKAASLKLDYQFNHQSAQSIRSDAMVPNHQRFSPNAASDPRLRAAATDLDSPDPVESSKFSLDAKQVSFEDSPELLEMEPSKTPLIARQQSTMQIDSPIYRLQETTTEILFTSEDKDRIFFHALKSKRQPTSLGTSYYNSDSAKAIEENLKAQLQDARKDIDRLETQLAQKEEIVFTLEQESGRLKHDMELQKEELNSAKKMSANLQNASRIMYQKNMDSIALLKKQNKELLERTLQTPTKRSFQNSLHHRSPSRSPLIGSAQRDVSEDLGQPQFTFTEVDDVDDDADGRDDAFLQASPNRLFGNVGNANFRTSGMPHSSSNNNSSSFGGSALQLLIDRLRPQNQENQTSERADNTDANPT